MLNDWGLTLEDGTLVLEGRQVMAPHLLLQNITISGSSDFGRDCMNKACFEPVSIDFFNFLSRIVVLVSGNTLLFVML